jgi:hypothetical protein
VRLVAALALLALGCGNQAAPTSCADAAKRGVDGLLKRAHEQHNDKLDAVAPRLRALIENRCTDDRWPAAVIDCYAVIASMEDMRACRAKLAPAHQARLEHEELDLFAGGSGPPGFGSAAPATSPEVKRLEATVRSLNSKLAEETKQQAVAASDAEREAARSAVVRTQQALRVANDALAAARVSAAQRP